MPTMEAIKLKTLDDLLLSPEDRVELIGGDIVRRPMTRFAHAQAQSSADRCLGPFTDGASPNGWWIVTDVSVAYEPHECPSHDLAGWRRERLPNPPDGVARQQVIPPAPGREALQSPTANPAKKASAPNSLPRGIGD
jgi:hypothetical protein